MPEGRRLLKPPRTFAISSELRKRLEALPPAGRRSECPLDAEKQAALLEFWPKLQHKPLARELGLSHTTALRWYRILTEGKKTAP